MEFNALKGQDEKEGAEKEVIVRSNEQTKTKWHHVDYGMITSKLGYFFQNAKDACYWPYMILFLTTIGFTPGEAGKINGLRFIGFIVGAPLWGLLADYKRKHAVIIVILCLSSLVLISFQPFVSIPLSTSSKCGAKVNRTATSNANHMSNVRNNSGVAIPINEGNKLHGVRGFFEIMLVINLLAGCFDGATVGFVDSGVMKKIQSKSGRPQFGTQRVFGAVGFGSGAFLSSLTVEYLTSPNLPCYTTAFIVYGILILSLCLTMYTLFNSLPCGKQVQVKRKGNDCLSQGDKVNIGTYLQKTLWHPDAIFFLLTTLIVGTMHGLYIAFLFLLLKEIQCPNVVMGLSLVVGAASALVFIKFCEQIIKALGGTMMVLSLACLSWGIRYLLFTYMASPWVVLPIQLLQGPGYGLFIAASVVNVRQISHPVIYTSMYGIFNGLFFGAGQIFGNVIGGALLMSYNIRQVFFRVSIVGFVWTTVMVVYMIIRHLKTRMVKKFIPNKVPGQHR